MNIKVPNGMKSPTVVIVGNSSENSQDKFSKQIDNLERRIDQRLKTKKDPIVFIERLHKSFMSRIDKFFSMHKAVLERTNDKRLQSVRNEFNVRVKDLSKNTKNNNKEELRRLSTQLNALESAIKKMSLQPRVIQKTIQRTVRVNQKPKNEYQDLISLAMLRSIERKLNRQMIPSPS